MFGLNRSRARRVLGVFMVVALSGVAVAVAEPASAATGCSRSWHYITHGETGLNLEPRHGADGSRPLHATGVPGYEYWNQQFLFCRDPGWGDSHYGIYSNMSGGYCGNHTGHVSCEYTAIADENYLFEIRRYDSTWWYIRTLFIHPFASPLIYPDRTTQQLPRNPIVTDLHVAPLAGYHLFRITPNDLMG